MIVHLVALVIVPALAMPAFAMLFTADRLEDAASARRIAVEMQRIVALEEVRSALRDEALEAGIRTISIRLGISVEDLQASLGDFPMRPIPESRAATDQALEVVRTTGGSGSPAVAQLGGSLAQARDVVDEATAAADPVAEDVWRVYLRYNEVYELISLAQQDAIHGIVVGRHGEVSSQVLDAAFELAVTRELGEVLFRQMAALQGLATTPGPSDQRDLIYRIDTDRRVSTAQLQTLPPILSEESARWWVEFADDPDFQVFDTFLQEIIDRDDATTGVDELISVEMPEFVRAGTAVIPISEAIGDLIGGSVDRGVRAAAQDEHDAEFRARVAVLATVALLVVTCAGLVLVGGTLRRDLMHLASAAGRLRTGRLERVPVEGPREIALVAEALNDAVDNLGRVANQAEVLASGHLDDPSLQEPVPGALGTAVHASFERLVYVVREQERLRNQLAHQVAHDRLTGLPNRAEGERVLVQALGRADRSGKPAAVLFVDLDDFKDINDTLGHAAGDQVLIAAAERMVATVRPEDTVCRIGGDEFVVVLEGRPGLTVDEATAVAHRIRTALAEPIHFHGTTVAIGASIGIALSGGVTDPSVLRSHADTAMYRAKAAGADGIEVYDERLDASGLPRRPVRHRNRAAGGATRPAHHRTSTR